MKNMKFELDKYYEGAYPSEAVTWANANWAHVELIDSGYILKKNHEPTIDELASQVRTERDRKIAETDWYMMPDYPADPETLEVVKNYRKALRDITLQSGFPRDVEWPVMPKVFCEDTEGTPSIGLAKVGIL